MAATAPAVDPVEAVETTVHCFQKNQRETVRATLSNFRGREIADLRVYVTDEHGRSVPTRKGLAVRVEELPALRDAVEALLEAAA